MFNTIHPVHLRYFELLAEYGEWQKEVNQEFPGSDYTKNTLPPVYHTPVEQWRVKLETARHLLDVTDEEIQAHKTSANATI